MLSTNGTAGTYVLKGERPSVYTGTPFNFVSTPINAPAPTELYFIIDDFNAGAQVPDVGSGSTAVTAGPVLAVAGSQGDARWYESDGMVQHVKLDPRQGFFACNSNVEGEQIDVLSWGVEGVDGEVPVGCRKTTVIVRQ